MIPRKISRFWTRVDVSMKQNQTFKKNDLCYCCTSRISKVMVVVLVQQSAKISVTRTKTRENITGKRRDNIYFWSNLDKIFPLCRPISFPLGE